MSVESSRLIEGAVLDEWEPELVAKLLILVSKTAKWSTDDVSQCIIHHCPELLQVAAFNEPLVCLLEPSDFIDLIRNAKTFFPQAKDLSMAYVELRAVIKIKSPKMLYAISQGWSFSERTELITKVIDDSVDSIKAAAKLVKKAYRTLILSPTSI